LGYSLDAELPIENQISDEIIADTWEINKGFSGKIEHIKKEIIRIRIISRATAKRCGR
jgi:hypothetical protein